MRDCVVLSLVGPVPFFETMSCPTRDFAGIKLPVAGDDKGLQSLLIKYDTNRNGMIEVYACTYPCL